MWKNNIKIALRNLFKNKVYSLINIGGLAIGLAAFLAISLYIRGELNYDRFHRNFNNIYRLTEIQKQADGYHPVAVTPGPLAPSLVSEYAEIEYAGRIGQWSALLQIDTSTIESKSTLIVEHSFFKMFDFKLLYGDTATVFNHPDEIILSESIAKRFFGENWRNASILGKILMLNNEQPHTIVGVVQNPPTNSNMQFEVLLPFKDLEKYDEWSNKWNSNSYHTYLQLRPDTDVAAFEHKIANHIAKYDANNEATLHLQPLSAVYLYSKFDFGSDWGKRGDIFSIRVFFTLGITLLLIAIFNFINLATARAIKRAREVGIRKSVGAQRYSLIGQFLGESLLMTTLAVLLAILLTQPALSLFNNLIDKDITMPTDQPQFWVILAAGTILVGLLTGGYPAFFLSAYRPSQVLKGIIDARSGLGFRKTLVVGQFILSLTLGIGAVVIYQQLNFVQNKKLGFDQSQLLFVRLKGETRDKSAILKDELSKIPTITSVTATTGNLVDVSNSSTVEWEGQTPNDEFLITQMNIDANFMTTTGMSLASGRNFSAEIAGDTTDKFGRYMLNETAAKRMVYTNESVLGKKVKFWGLEGEVIGVLKDFHFRPLNKTIEPFIFRFRPKEFYFDLLLKLAPNDMPTTIAAIEEAYKKVDADHPFSYGFVDQSLETQYKAEQRTGRTVLYFAILTIFISCLGLFGLVAFAAEQRTKEIGVRKVLGASVASIVGLLSKDFLKLVLIALIIASPMAYALMQRWLADFAYRIDIQWWMFAFAGLVAITIAFLTVAGQAVRSAIVNPVKSLRNE
jgi:putative ABC transport system permease protein